MSDLLLNLSRSTFARSVVKKSKLPLKLPPVLLREDRPWSHQTLLGKQVVLGGRRSIGMVEGIERALWDAGATIVTSEVPLSGVVFDATSISTVEGLSDLYAFMHSCIPQFLAGAKVLLVGRVPLSAGSTIEIAIQESLTGFARSLAKELGPKGICVNMIEMTDGAALDGAIRFFLSNHSAFVTGQVIVVGGQKFHFGERFEELLQERTILVTGAAQGIGAAISRRLANEGAKIILLDRPQEITALETLAKELNGIILPVELGKEESNAAVVKKLWEYAPLHGVVHNAGITRDRTLGRMNSDRWNDVLTLNLQVPLSMTELILSQENNGLFAKDAAVVFMSSVGGIAGNPGQTNYAASKSGLIGYARALAARHFDSGVRFNCVAPGFIETRMTAAMPFAVREMARRFNSLNQGGIPDDVAQGVAWLISRAGAGVNGQTLRVCGQNLIGA